MRSRGVNTSAFAWALAAQVYSPGGRLCKSWFHSPLHNMATFGMHLEQKLRIFSAVVESKLLYSLSSMVLTVAQIWNLDGFQIGASDRSSGCNQLLFLECLTQKSCNGQIDPRHRKFYKSVRCNYLARFSGARIPIHFVMFPFPPRSYPKLTDMSDELGDQTRNGFRKCSWRLVEFSEVYSKPSEKLSANTSGMERFTPTLVLIFLMCL